MADEIILEGSEPVEETETTPEASEQTDVNDSEVSIPEPKIDWEKKYGESTREFQRLNEERKADKALVEELKAESDKYRKLLEDTNPEAYDAIKVKESLANLEKKLLLEREERVLTDFVKDNPIAAQQKDAIRKLFRAEPDRSVNEIWESYFKPVYESGARSVEERSKATKAKQPESGKRSISPEPAGELNMDTFSKLPLAQQKEILKKMGF